MTTAAPHPKCEICRRLTAVDRVRLTPFGPLIWLCRICHAKKVKAK